MSPSSEQSGGLWVVCQGPKLTFYAGAKWRLKFFFSRQMEKSGRQKVVCKIFAS